MREHILQAIADFDQGTKHSFGESTGYDVLFNKRRYPPKALIGLAAGRVTGRVLGPYDFKGGLRSRCFQILTSNGFEIVVKENISLFLDEVTDGSLYLEGSIEQVWVNRYERDCGARSKAINHFGLNCQVCSFNFESTYGEIGAGFIHVHHIVPLADIGKEYQVDPIRDLRPVCPNCHAMLHKRTPPYSIDELRKILKYG